MKLAFICSLILSIIHSILFFGEDWGISVVLFAISAVFLFILVLGKNGKIKKKAPLVLSVPIILLSATYFLFNNMFFAIMNFFVIIALFAIMIIWACTGDLNPVKLLKNIWILLFAPVTEVTEVARQFSANFHVEKQPGKAKNPIAWKIVKALLISFPIVIIVIALLVAADETFGVIFRDIVNKVFEWINLGTIFKIALRIIFATFLTIYFVGIILKITRGKVNNDVKPNRKGLRIEGMTLGMLITLLNIVYFIFSGIQVMHIVEQITLSDITSYAGLAREGFFQLMVVSFINFAIILLSKSNKKEMGVGSKTYIKSMNFILALFTIVLLVTSVIKMTLYAQEYGYTFLRILVFVTQITEVLLILPTLVYIISDRFKVAKWYLAIIVVMYVLFNFMNVDNFIAQQNIDRYLNNTNTQTRKIDFEYLRKNGSADSIPQIIRLLDVKDTDLQREVNNYLYNQKLNAEEAEITWQSFNISRLIAKWKLESLNIEYKYNNKKNNSIYDYDDYDYYDNYYTNNYYNSYNNSYYNDFNENYNNIYTNSYYEI